MNILVKLNIFKNMIGLPTIGFFLAKIQFFLHVSRKYIHLNPSPGGATKLDLILISNWVLKLIPKTISFLWFGYWQQYPRVLLWGLRYCQHPKVLLWGLGYWQYPMVLLLGAWILAISYGSAYGGLDTVNILCFCFWGLDTMDSRH